MLIKFEQRLDVQHLTNWYGFFWYENSVQMALEWRIIFKMLFPENWPAVFHMKMLLWIFKKSIKDNGEYWREHLNVIHSQFRVIDSVGRSCLKLGFNGHNCQRINLRQITSRTKMLTFWKLSLSFLFYLTNFLILFINLPPTTKGLSKEILPYYSADKHLQVL